MDLHGEDAALDDGGKRRGRKEERKGEEVIARPTNFQKDTITAPRKLSGIPALKKKKDVEENKIWGKKK